MGVLIHSGSSYEAVFFFFSPNLFFGRDLKLPNSEKNKTEKKARTSLQTWAFKKKRKNGSVPASCDS